jgi:hypothetical protein
MGWFSSTIRVLKDALESWKFCEESLQEAKAGAFLLAEAAHEASVRLQEASSCAGNLNAKRA